MTEDAHRRSKRPANPLAGPYGHPFHAIAVTVPIGAWLASIVFDTVGLITGDDDVFAAGARVLIVIGLVGALAASALGLMDLSRLDKGTSARRTAVTHMLLNIGVMLLFVVSLIIRLSSPDAIPAAGVIVSVCGLAVLGASGWLGGKLAYHYGVRVADEQTQREGFR